MIERFRDRTDAGRQLARLLEDCTDRPDVLVVALTRGGVPVGFEVARALGCAFDVLAVHKLGVPGRPEMALGAIASGGTCVLDPDVVRAHLISSRALEAILAVEREVLERRDRDYHSSRRRTQIEGRTVILVDDGLEKGLKMRAAIQAVGRQRPASMVVAVPIAPPEAAASFRHEINALHHLIEPRLAWSVDLWYQDCRTVGDPQIQGMVKAGRESMVAVH